MGIRKLLVVIGGILLVAFLLWAGSAEAAYQYSVRLYQEEEYSRAARWVVSALRVNPYHLRALRHKGLTMNRLNRYDEAAGTLELAARRIPNDAEIRRELGLAYLNLGQSGPALTHLQEAIRIDPDSGPAKYTLGNVYYSAGEWLKASEQYRIAIGLEPNNPDYLNSLAAASIHLKFDDDAQSLLLKAIELRPVFPKAYTNLAELRSRQGRLSEAIQYIEKAMEQDDDFTFLVEYYTAGKIYEQAERRDEAIKAYRTFVEKPKRTILPPDIESLVDKAQKRLTALGASS